MISNPNSASQNELVVEGPSGWPVRYTDRGQPFAFVVGLILGLVLLLGGLIGVGTAVGSGAGAGAYIFSAFACVMGLILLTLVYFGSTRINVEVSRDWVRFNKKYWLSGQKSWEEPLKSYIGISSHYISGGDGGRSYYYHKLVHGRDASKDVQIYQSPYNVIGYKETTIAYVKFFKLPLVTREIDQSVSIIRAHDEIDLTLKQRIEQEKVVISDSELAIAPSNSYVACTNQDGNLIVACRASKHIGFMLFITALVLVLFAAFIFMDAGIIITTVVFAFALICILALLAMSQGEERVIFCPDHTYKHEWSILGRVLYFRQKNLDCIDEIWPSFFDYPLLVIRSNRRFYYLGFLLPGSDRIWLQKLFASQMAKVIKAR